MIITAKNKKGHVNFAQPDNRAKDARPFLPLLIKDKSPLSFNEMLAVLYREFRMNSGSIDRSWGGLDEVVEPAIIQNTTVVQLARTLATAQKFNVELDEKYRAEKLLPEMLGEMSLHGRRLGKALSLLLSGTENYVRTYQTTIMVFSTVRRLMVTQKVFAENSKNNLAVEGVDNSVLPEVCPSSIDNGQENEIQTGGISTGFTQSYSSDRPFFVRPATQDETECESKAKETVKQSKSKPMGEVQHQAAETTAQKSEGFVKKDLQTVSNGISLPHTVVLNPHLLCQETELSLSP